MRVEGLQEQGVGGVGKAQLVREVQSWKQEHESWTGAKEEDAVVGLSGSSQKLNWMGGQ